MRRYFENVGAGFSHLLNAITGGSPKVSFSARVGAAEHRGEPWAHVVSSFIDALLFSRNHCLEHASEEGLI